MDRVREHLAHADTLSHRLQQQSWFVDAVEIYCDAARGLAGELVSAGVASRALGRMCDYLRDYLASESFTTLDRETSAVKQRIAGLCYQLRIQGPRVTVSRYESEEDYSIGVLETFAKFRQAAAKGYLVALSSEVEMNHIEAQILRGCCPAAPRDSSRRCATYCAPPPRLPRRDDRAVRPRGAVLPRLPGAHRPLAGRRDCRSATHTYRRQSKETAVRGHLRYRAGEQARAREDRAVVCNDFHLEGRSGVRGQRAEQRRQDDLRAYLRAAALPGGLGLPVPGRERAAVPARPHLHALRAGGGHRDSARQVRRRARPGARHPRARHRATA